MFLSCYKQINNDLASKQVSVVRSRKCTVAKRLI